MERPGVESGAFWGDLAREGRAWVLRGAQDFKLVADSEDW